MIFTQWQNCLTKRCSEQVLIIDRYTAALLIHSIDEGTEKLRLNGTWILSEGLSPTLSRRFGEARGNRARCLPKRSKGGGEDVNKGRECLLSTLFSSSPSPPFLPPPHLLSFLLEFERKTSAQMQPPVLVVIGKKGMEKRRGSHDSWVRHRSQQTTVFRKTPRKPRVSGKAFGQYTKAR